MVLITMAYLALFMFIFYDISLVYKMKGYINTYIMFVFSILIYYILIPLLTLSTTKVRIPTLRFKSIIDSASLSNYIYAFSYVLITYFIVYIFYRVKFKRQVKVVESKSEAKKNNSSTNITDNTNNINNTIGIALLIIGLASQLIIISHLGGIKETLQMGDILRSYSGSKANYIPQGKLFLFTLMPVSIASFYIIVTSYRIKKSKAKVVLIFLSMLSTIIYLILDAGRLGVMLVLITFVFDYAFRKKRKPLLFIIFSSLILILSLSFLDGLFFYLSYGYFKSNSLSIFGIIEEFSFPYSNNLYVHDINEIYGMRFGKDYFSWMINIWPQRLLSLLNIQTINPGYSIITEYVRGENSTGGIPTDWITLNIRQFGVFGLIIGNFIISRVLHYLDKIIEITYDKNLVFLTTRITTMFLIIIPYADLDSFVKNRIDMFIVLFFYLFLYYKTEK